MKSYLIILTLFMPIFAAAAEKVDLKRNQMFSIMPIPHTEKVVVGLVDVENGRAGFAFCRLRGSEPEKCRLSEKRRFSFRAMGAVQSRVQAHLSEQNQSFEVDGFEVGALSALGLTPGEIGVYYGLKAFRAEPRLSAEEITQVSRLFNMDLNSPRFVSIAGLSHAQVIRVLSALQNTAF